MEPEFSNGEGRQIKEDQENSNAASDLWGNQNNQVYEGSRSETFEHFAVHHSEFESCPIFFPTFPHQEEMMAHTTSSVRKIIRVQPNTPRVLKTHLESYKTISPIYVDPLPQSQVNLQSQITQNHSSPRVSPAEILYESPCSNASCHMFEDRMDRIFQDQAPALLSLARKVDLRSGLMPGANNLQLPSSFNEYLNAVGPQKLQKEALTISDSGLSGRLPSLPNAERRTKAEAKHHARNDDKFGKDSSSSAPNKPTHRGKGGRSPFYSDEELTRLQQEADEAGKTDYKPSYNFRKPGRPRNNPNSTASPVKKSRVDKNKAVTPRRLAAVSSRHNSQNTRSQALNTNSLTSIGELHDHVTSTPAQVQVDMPHSQYPVTNGIQYPASLNSHGVQGNRASMNNGDPPVTKYSDFPRSSMHNQNQFPQEIHGNDELNLSGAGFCWVSNQAQDTFPYQSNFPPAQFSSYDGQLHPDVSTARGLRQPIYSSCQNSNATQNDTEFPYDSQASGGRASGVNASSAQFSTNKYLQGQSDISQKGYFTMSFALAATPQPHSSATQAQGFEQTEANANSYVFDFESKQQGGLESEQDLDTIEGES